MRAPIGWWPWVPVLLVVTYAAGLAVRPPALESDAADGLLTLQSMQRGAPWNHYDMLEPSDIRTTQRRFTAWWSPGQYMLPAMLLSVGVTLGQAVAVINVLCIAFGLIGYFRLFLALGVPVATSRTAVALMAASSVVAVEVRTYSGGETLLFGATAWLVLAAVRMASWRVLTRFSAVVLLGLVGLFLKLSFVITAVGMICALALLAFEREGYRWPIARREALAIVGVAGGLYTAMHLLFLQFGHHQAPHGLDPSPLPVLHSAAGAMLTAAGIGEIVGEWHLGSPSLVAGLIVAGVAQVALLGWIASTRLVTPAYRAFAIGLALAYAAALLWSYAAVVGVNHDNRHFRAAGFLLLPGLLTWVRATGWRVLRAAVVLTLAIGALAGPVTYVAEWRRHGDGAVGRHGVTQAEVPPAVLRALHVIDRSAPADAVFGVPSATLTLELTRLRSVEVIGHDVPYYRGRVSDVYLLSIDPGWAEEKLALFEDYPRDQWRTFQLTGAVLHVQGATADEDIARWLGDSLVSAPPGAWGR